MDIKYLTTGIIGFIIGLTINLTMEINAWTDIETPEHVKRYQYLHAFESQQRDPLWAAEMEQQITDAFSQSDSIGLDYLQCYTDICAYSFNEVKSLDHISRQNELDKIYGLLDETVLQGSVSNRHDLSASGTITINQYKRES